MKLKFTLALLLTFCGLSTFAAVTGETPVSGSSYLIYNVGQQKYLTVSGTNVSLGDAGTQFTVTQNSTTGLYTLTASNQLSATYPYGVVCSSDGYYTDWKFSLLSSTDKTYALGVLEDEDAYSFSYIFYSTALDAVANAPVMPSFTDGQWIFTTGESTPEVTYTVTVEPLEDMAYDATSATVKYTVKASTGETYNCTKDVTFAANDTYEAVTRSGEFTDATYNVKVAWSVKLGAKPITYSLGTVDVPNVDYDVTSATITYTILPSYGNDIHCSHDVTFEANDTDEEVTRTGEFTDETYNILVPWTVIQGVKPAETVSEVSFDEGDTSIEIPGNLADAVNVKLYRTSAKANIKGTLCLPFDITHEQFLAAFGSRAQAYEFIMSTGTRVYYGITVNLKAGVPYMIIPSAARSGSYYSFENVKGSSFTDETTDVQYGSYIFHGTLVKTTTDQVVYGYGASSGTFGKFKAGTTFKGFRSYYIPDASADTSKAVEEYIVDDETGIIDLNSKENLYQPIYNTSGQMVKTTDDSVEGLAPGIYIVNGKKVVIK